MERLKIAIQKSGRLLEDSLGLLNDCSVKVDNGRDQLRAQAKNFPLDVLYLRNSDIPQYVEDGVADVGIIGENLLVETGCQLDTVLPLGFAKCRLSLAVPKGQPYTGIQDFQGKKIATSYPNTLRNYLQRNQVDAEIHVISGSVEIAPAIGLAEGICDLVSSGNTLFQNNLVEKEVILRSEAVLAATPQMSDAKRSILEQLVFRMESVLKAQSNKYILLNAPNERLEEIIAILPGMKSPTVLPLAVTGWSSVHTVIQEDKFWEIIHELKAKGAQGILVVPIQKMII
ncbi:MAG TPA: ATP phosphoribosyltransferase [Saprospiraceae bacterium]|nr:ATP phosphoribosyltransferase [Saprospiraceae bacterium]MCB9271486.1 ATP phosphoribosyltransferase [Lewinellaceae bacterium]HPG08365.1 ATP phosphoribosyltransferase [Saprospiraceae bacterium]HPR00302.1 ATP phosphoribosyltransferase [Saprospiraceae bacterium]HQU51624.1 ATP phosphoribosyltransferase [Saprospiraceae bacterium]